MRACILNVTTLACVALAISCGDPTPAMTRDLQLQTAPIEATEFDTGTFTLQISSAEILAADLVFLSAGEAHSSLSAPLLEALIPSANAHPGHFQGGAITGELPGTFTLEFSDSPNEIGNALVQLTDYESVDFMFMPADGDATAIFLHGALTSVDGDSFPLLIEIDPPAERRITGIPFPVTVDATNPGAAVLHLSLQDTFDDTAVFDDIDWIALVDEAESQGSVVINAESSGAESQAAYALLRQRLLTHNHYYLQSLP